MTGQAAADERLREAVAEWLTVHEREHPGEAPVDLVVVAHFRSWTDSEMQIDDYEVIVPAGTSYHSALGLMSHGLDIHSTLADEDEDDD